MFPSPGSPYLEEQEVKAGKGSMRSAVDAFWSLAPVQDINAVQDAEVPGSEYKWCVCKEGESVNISVPYIYYCLHN